MGDYLRKIHTVRSGGVVFFFAALLFVLLGSVGFLPSAGAHSDETTIRKCYCHNICNGSGGDQCTSSIGEQQGHQKSVNCHTCLVSAAASCNSEASDYDYCFSGEHPPCANSVEDSFGKCDGCGNGIIDPGEACDDGNNQNGDGCNENCQKECVGGCDDGNSCTIDSCDNSTGLCQYTPNADAACDDGNACTTSDSCQSDTTCAGTAVICTPLDQCHGTGTCNPESGLCSNPQKEDGSACSDNSSCTDQDQCVGGECVPGPAISCDDANPCTDDSVCDSESGCVHTNIEDGTACSDEDACNGVETCQSGACMAGTPPNCDDGNPCTEDSCNSDLNESPCVHTPIDTGQVICGVGVCQRIADRCVEGQPQTCIPGEPSTEICDGVDNDCDGIADGPGICESVASATDTDGDGVPDSIDNCPADFNPDQLDTNGDGIGDLCEEVVSAPAGGAGPIPAAPGGGNSSAGGCDCSLATGVTKAESGDLFTLGLMVGGIGLMGTIRRWLGSHEGSNNHEGGI